MSAQTKISVIIPHLNQPEFLARCLASLEAQQGDVPEFEILVVDNGSRQLPHDVVEKVARARLLQETRPGPGPARNAGVAAAIGEILCFIDADCTADPGWLARITAHLETHADQGILGGDVYIARDGDRATALEAYESVYAYRMAEYIAQQGFTGTGNLAVRRSIWDAVGTFGGKDIAEDRDWGQRAGAKGYVTTYVEGMIVYHPARKDFGELQEKWNRHTSHDYVRLYREGGGHLKWLARSAALAVSPVAELGRIVRSKRVRGPRERALAFWVLVKIRLYRAWIMLRMALSAQVAERMSAAWNK